MTVQEFYTKHQLIYTLHPVEFSRKEVMYDGFKIVVFSYTKAAVGEYKLFKELDAFEMRGITFVFNTDDTVYKCFLALRKFYNVDENEDNTFDILDKKIIICVNNKDDGSLIQVIELPNGKILGKTKNDFFGFHSTRATELLHSPEFKYHYDFSKTWLSADCTPMFEYVGTAESEARVVLKYPKEDLILIRIRNNITGEFVNIHDLSEEDHRNMTINKKLNFTSLSEIREYLNNAEDIEGVVITWADGTMNKWKCLWYCKNHYFRMDFLKEKFRENVIIQAVIDQALDRKIAKDNSDTISIDKDVISQLKSILTEESDKEVLERCILKFETVEKTINKLVNQVFFKVKEIYDYYLNEKPLRRVLYEKYGNTPEFSIISSSIDKEGNLNLHIDNDKDLILERIYVYIERNTRKLEMAKNFLKKIN